MRIQLKKLTLQNFKGIRSLSVSFFDTTNIYGQNATGKTTIFDAFLWLLFGKDSSDRTDFEIKTLDENNEPYHRLDHEVSATLEVDGEEILIKRTLREKWVKKQGKSEAVFTGHETIFFWNDVPQKEKEFQDKIAGILNEKVFKLITNSGYFNSLKWQDRRAVLLQLAGNISDQDIASTNSSLFIPLLEQLAKKTTEEFKRELAAKKRKIKDELDLVPARIDEANRSLPEELQYSAIQRSLAEAETSLAEVEGILMDKSQSQIKRQQEVTSKLQEIQHLRQDVLNIEFGAKNEVKNRKQQRDQVTNDKRRSLLDLNSNFNSLSSDIIRLQAQKTNFQNQQDELRKQWNTVNERKLEFNENEFCCPTCKREYEAADVDAKKTELTNNFNESKSRKLSEITSTGAALGQDISLIDSKVSNFTADKEKLGLQIEKVIDEIRTLEDENIRLSESEAEEIKNFLSTDRAYQDTLAKINQLESDVNTPFAGEDTSMLLSKKNLLKETIDTYKSQLATKQQREKTLARIAELERQEKELASQLANLEGTEFAILEFEKAKMDVLETRVNGRFQIVRFKLFAQQINGGEVACCETLINGVPYQDANTASKVQGGIDIINVLSDHFGVVAPIFIDNRESVIQIPDTDAQIVNLIVSSPDKKLRIESEYREAVAV